MVGVCCAICRSVQHANYVMINGTSLCNRCADTYQGTQSKLAQGTIQKMVNQDPRFKEFGPVDFKYFFENDCSFSKENLKEIKAAVRTIVRERKAVIKSKEDKLKAGQDYVDNPVRRRDIASKQVPDKTVTIQKEETEPSTYTNVERTVTTID